MGGVAKAFRSVTRAVTKPFRRSDDGAKRAAAEAERKYKQQQQNFSQQDRKNRKDNQADESSLRGMGYEEGAAGIGTNPNDLSGLGYVDLDGKLKRKKLGGS